MVAGLKEASLTEIIHVGDLLLAVDGDSVEDVSKGRAARLARLGTSRDERAKVQLIARPCRGHASKHPVDFPLFGALPVGRVDTTFTKPYTKLAKRLRSGSSLKLDHRVG